jgi:hypothetical protein
MPQPNDRDLLENNDTMSALLVWRRARRFTDMQGMSWRVHTMGPMMRGRNFLSWHRQFVLRLELRAGARRGLRLDSPPAILQPRCPCD